MARLRVAGCCGVDLGVLHVPRHDQVQHGRLVERRVERHQLDRLQPFHVGVAVGHLEMAVLLRVAVAGEVFAAGHDRVVVQTADDRAPQAGHLLRRVGDRAPPDDRVLGVGVHVQHGREVQVETGGRQLATDDGADLVGQRHRGHLPQVGHVREHREGFGQPMDQPALLVDADEGRHATTHRPQRLGQVEHLFEGLEVALEKDEAAEAPFFIEPQQLLGDARAVETDDQPLANASFEGPQIRHERSVRAGGQKNSGDDGKGGLKPEFPKIGRRNLTGDENRDNPRIAGAPRKSP
jgi:hypothetical protein